MRGRTAEQRAALREAYRLLSNQFDDVLMICSMQSDHEMAGTDMDVYWCGGWVHAHSLAHFAQKRIEYQKQPAAEPK